LDAFEYLLGDDNPNFLAPLMGLQKLGPGLVHETEDLVFLGQAAHRALKYERR